MNTVIEKGTKLTHKTEGLTAVVIAISHVKQNACIQWSDGYVEIQDLNQIELNFNVTK